MFRENPGKYLDDLRSEDPVHHDEEFDRVILTRAADIDSVLNDRSLLIDPRNARSGDAARKRPVMLNMDGPDQKRWRSLIAKRFSQNSAEAMREKVKVLANQLLDEISDPSCFDVVEAYAKPLPAMIMAEVLGAEPPDAKDFQVWAYDNTHLFNPRRITEGQQIVLDRASRSAADYFFELRRKRRTERGTDLVSELIAG